MRFSLKQRSRNPLGFLPEVRSLSAPVVEPTTAKLSLGATASPYLNNLAEMGSLTAVISSIGQIPSSRIESQAISRQDLELRSESIPITKQVSLDQVFQGSLLTDTPIQTIFSLSELRGNHSADLVSSSQIQNSKITPIPQMSIAQEVQLQGQVISIEYLSLANSPLSKSVSTVGSATVSAVNMGLAQRPANDEFNLSQISGLANSTPVSTLTSLSTPTVADAKSRESMSFEGITVSGQADSLDFLIIISAVSNPAIAPFQLPHDRAVASAMNTGLGEGAEIALPLHSIILISAPAAPVDEAFGI